MKKLLAALGFLMSCKSADDQARHVNSDAAYRAGVARARALLAILRAPEQINALRWIRLQNAELSTYTMELPDIDRPETLRAYGVMQLELADTVNNLNVPPGGEIWKIKTTGDVQLTGITPELDGAYHALIDMGGSGTLHLRCADWNSTTRSRLAYGADADLPCTRAEPPDGIWAVVYRAADARWHIITKDNAP